jgi:hypothetical protein
MTLVLVLLAGAAMVGLAQRSFVGALEAESAERELQRRWAVTSMRATLLGRLESLLAELEGFDPNAPPDKQRLPAPARGLTVELGDARYDLVVTDEQAKLNANRLLRANTRGQAESAIRELTGAAPASVVRVRPTRGVKAVFGYGQLFHGVAPGQLVGQPDRGGLARNVTCWGDGKVNIARAPEDVIVRACRREVGPRVVRLLLEHRRNNPAAGLDELLKRIDRLGDKDRGKLEALLTDRSSCHGLWIVTRANRRQWYTLAVSVTANGQVVQWYEFAW